MIKEGNFKAVFNLDGSINRAKTDSGKGRTLKMNTELENAKKAVLFFLKENELNIESDLASDYEINWNEEFTKEMTEFIDSMKLFEESIKAGDKTAQVCSLMWARIRVLNIFGFFQNIFEDVEYIYLSEDFNWPTLPEGYKIPERFFARENVLKNILGK